MKVKEATAYILNRLTNELPTELTYHWIGHTLDVVAQARRIALSENILDKQNLLLLETAAYFHDAGFIETYQNHEEKSCEIAQMILPSFDYTLSEITAICTIIMATKIPQSPTNHLSEIICDADLDYLGREDFLEIGQRLYQELLYKNLVKNQHQWNEIQLLFLKKHKYFTKTNIESRNIVKLNNIEQIGQNLCESGLNI